MKTIPLVGCLCLLGFLTAACQREADVGARGAASGSPDAAPRAEQPRPLAPFQRELLVLAFDAASRFPSDPHAKNRGAAQGRVLAACVELGESELVLGFAPRVEGWRRGLAYADGALARARDGQEASARELVALAQKVLEEQSADPNAQQWRADTVRLKLARALRALGDAAASQRLASEIDNASRGAVDATWADVSASWVEEATREQAVEEVARIDAALSTMVFGDQFTALTVLVRLHERFFDDAALRAQLARRVLDEFVKMPPNLRLEGMARICAHCLDRADVDGAREVLLRMDELVAGVAWRPEDGMPQIARLAELRHRAGETERALRSIDAALADYHQKRDAMFDVERCEALRPLALALITIGEDTRGRELLALAVEEGAENPNARPRCDDLVDTCVALAVRGIEPGEALLQRLREIRDGLSDPW